MSFEIGYLYPMRYILVRVVFLTVLLFVMLVALVRAAAETVATSRSPRFQGLHKVLRLD